MYLCHLYLRLSKFGHRLVHRCVALHHGLHEIFNGRLLALARGWWTLRELRWRWRVKCIVWVTPAKVRMVVSVPLLVAIVTSFISVALLALESSYGIHLFHLRGGACISRMKLIQAKLASLNLLIGQLQLDPLQFFFDDR